MGGSEGEHQGWISLSCTIMQVSNVVPRYVKGKVQLSQLLGVGYVGGSEVAVQTATNPVRVVLPSDLNLTVSVLVLLMKLHGWEIDPQCFEKLSSSTQTQEQDEQEYASYISKCRKVMLILGPSSSTSVQVYTNKKNQYEIYNFYSCILPDQHCQDSLEDILVK